MFGAEAPHCLPHDTHPDRDSYHKQWVRIRKDQSLPTARSLLRDLVPQAVTCPIRDSDGNQTGLMDFWSCGDQTVSDHTITAALAHGL